VVIELKVYKEKYMLIIPEIQIRTGKVVTNSIVNGTETVHDISPLEAMNKFIDEGAETIQIIDLDAAIANATNNESLIKELIQKADIPLQIGGGINTLVKMNDWFEAGAARLLVGTIAITDRPLLIEAASRYPGGIIVHLTTRDGHVIINGGTTETIFRPEEMIYELQMTGIVGVIHKEIKDKSYQIIEALALTETLSHDISIPVYTSGTVMSLDDVSMIQLMPNINGAVISHALFSNELSLPDIIALARQKHKSPDPDSITPIVRMGQHQVIRAYLAAYNSSQASRVWNLSLRNQIIEANPYMEVLVPQTDLDVDVTTISPREIQAYYEAELDKSDIVIVILDGVESKSWTGYECGYARAKGKYIYGVTSDYELSTINKQRFSAMCDELIHFNANDDVSASIDQIAHKLCTRTMVQDHQPS
jgi:phosphoribosylformimino-5-aminoimidazole carboxamide ribotide isomerase